MWFKFSSFHNSPMYSMLSLTVGVEGGFETDDKKYETEEQNCVVVMPDWQVLDLGDASLPPEVFKLLLLLITTINSSS